MRLPLPAALIVALSVPLRLFEPMLDFSMTAATLLNTITASIVLALLVPISIFALEAIAAVFGKPKKENTSAQVAPKTAILIPAHNESLVIGNTLQCLMANLKGSEQVVVVADNCSDDTAAIARSFGVTVLERHDTVRRARDMPSTLAWATWRRMHRMLWSSLMPIA